MRLLGRIFVLGCFLGFGGFLWAEQARVSEDNAGFDFALIGDLPYGLGAGIKYPPFDALQSSIERSGVDFVIHIGDIKSGQSQCSDQLLKDRLQRFNAFRLPFILTLGDNEWTDCHRRGMDPLERLDWLRQQFYATPNASLGQQRLSLETQASQSGFERYVEHQRWQHQGIQFVTLHLVGSRNGLLPFEGRTQAHDEEVKLRTEAAIEWMSSSFERAKQHKALGIVVVMHANPGLNSMPGFAELKNRVRPPPRVSNKGFERLLVALEAQVADFKRPVVLAHGDTHVHRIDQPKLGHQVLNHFTRVEVFGTSHSNWVKAKVMPLSEVVFEFEVMKSGRSERI